MQALYMLINFRAISLLILSSVPCIVQERCDHDAHPDSLYGTDGSWHCIMGKSLICLHQKGAVATYSIFCVSLFPSCSYLAHPPLFVQIAGFVNGKSSDASIQQVSLDILESMVLSSHSLFLQVKNEVTMERLIAHLQV